MPFARIAVDGIFRILGGSLTGFNAPPAAAVVDCPVIAPALGPVVEMTHGHPVMLYPPEGPARQHLACVIAKAAEMRLAPADGKSGLRVTRREQARQTSEQYRAARSRAGHSPASSA
jgi:hypothetical protein